MIGSIVALVSGSVGKTSALKSVEDENENSFSSGHESFRDVPIR